ncbi:MAG: hypothetical protein L6R37_008091 [Teloschistes peruensis]|nr:MAG: hypothetical protein L6R37_008091 [Teloschistes peruensis]
MSWSQRFNGLMPTISKVSGFLSIKISSTVRMGKNAPKFLGNDGFMNDVMVAVDRGLYDVRLQNTRQDPMTLEQPNPSSSSYSRSLIGGQRLDPDPMRRQVQYDDVQVPRHGRGDLRDGPQPVQHADEGRNYENRNGRRQGRYVYDRPEQNNLR